MADASRLTPGECGRITEAIESAVKGYGVNYRPTHADIPTLERVGAHAIGCTLGDLRESERGYLLAAVIVATGLDSVTVTQ